MFYIFLGFVALSVVCVFLGRDQLEKAGHWFEDPNLRPRAVEAQRMGYAFHVFSGASVLAALTTIALWIF